MPLKVQYCSDLHLEFPKNKDFLKINPLKPIGDILLLAGDILYFEQIAENKDFFDYLSDNFKYTFWVPGNHEYYRSDIIQRTGLLNENIRSNVFLVNNFTKHLPGVKMVFSTLWSHISPPNQLEVQYSVTDFYAIKNRGEKFTPHDFNRLHEESKLFLQKELSIRADVPTIVVSHHVPTLLHVPRKIITDVIWEAFAVELHDFIQDSYSDYWIYGHNHINKPEFKIGNTSLLTNQLGYVSHDQQKAFNWNAVIDLK